MSYVIKQEQADQTSAFAPSAETTPGLGLLVVPAGGLLAVVFLLRTMIAGRRGRRARA